MRRPSTYGHSSTALLLWFGKRFGSNSVSNATNLALPCGSTFSSSFLTEKPAHGTTIDHASTQRWRYTRSSGGALARKSSRSNVFGLPTSPPTSLFPPSVLQPFDAPATASLFVVNS